MPLHVIRRHTSQQLWESCADSFLNGAGDPDPRTHNTWIWLSHRNLRDRLLDTAQSQGHPGWLDPPITFFGDLAGLFGLRQIPVGILTRRRLVSRHAARLGREIFGREPGRAHGVIRGHMLDSVFADLLPEGIAPAELGAPLAQLEGDDFAERRNRWILSVYEAYLQSLDELGLDDWRSVNALLAERIEAGELPRVLRGARELHIYGITSSRTRRRFLTALAGQTEVDVHLYLPHESESDDFFEAMAAEVRVLEAGSDTATNPAVPHVQPAPDAAREMAWVARQVKRVLAAGEAEPHDVAVVARSGREDTRRAFRALRAAGVPASARIRTPLSEISALKALLLVLRGVARGWDYRSLRAVLDHPYFDAGVDLRGIDFIAARRRVDGLEAWETKLAQLHDLVVAESRETKGAGLFPDRLQRDVTAFGALRSILDPLGEPRSEAEWIETTLRLLREDRGVMRFRRRVCDPVEGRWDVVRSDQRGVVQLERLLREWAALQRSDTEVLEPGAWHALLHKLLEASELVLSTPGQKGVQVLEAHDAALVPFAHTFVVHANDGEFPRIGGASGLFSAEERVRLAELGVPLGHRSEALRRERALWRAVTQQEGRVSISYRTTDPGGTPLLPSLMVPDHDPDVELPRVRRPKSDLEPVTPAEADRLAAATLGRQLGNGASLTAPRTDPVPIHPSRPERIRRAIVAAVAEVHRGPGLELYPGSGVHPALRPNPWNGHLRDPEVLKRLAERFGEGHRWSAGQLEGYARSPFSYLLDRVLWIKSHEEAEEETTPLTFGSVAHEILERFYEEFRAAPPLSLDPSTARRLDEITNEVYREREGGGEWLGLPALWATSRATVRASVRDYVAWELAYLAEKGERAVVTERAFGFEETPLFIEGADVHGHPARVRLCGRIDRIDVSGAEGSLHHVLDYKSGYTPSATQYEDGTVLQGALYLQVLADEGTEVKYARYRSIKRPGRPQNGGQLAYGTDKHAHAIALALSIPARVRAGLFEPVASRRGGWKPWDIGLELRRNGAQLDDGHRFETDPALMTTENAAGGHDG